jgi:hypothetical protein
VPRDQLGHVEVVLVDDRHDRDARVGRRLQLERAPRRGERLVVEDEDDAARVEDVADERILRDLGQRVDVEEADEAALRQDVLHRLRECLRRAAEPRVTLAVRAEEVEGLGHGAGRWHGTLGADCRAGRMRRWNGIHRRRERHSTAEADCGGILTLCSWRGGIGGWWADGEQLAAQECAEEGEHRAEA